MNPTARFGLARSEAEKGNYQASLDIARPVLEAFKLFPEGLFVLATDFLKTGDRQAAIELVDHWNRSTDIPQAWSIRLARRVRRGRRPGGGHQDSRTGEDRRPRHLRAGLQPGRRVSVERRARPRPRFLRRSTAAQTGIACRAEPGGGGRGERAGTGAIAVVLDARQKDLRRTIPRSSSVSAACASRWICWRTPSPRSHAPPA